MKKRAIIYVEVLPLQLRLNSSLNRYSQIPQSILEKIGKQARDEEKTKSFPKRKHFGKLVF